MALLLVLTAGLVGCGGKKNFLNENDQLRRQNLEMADKMRDLEQQINQRINEIEALEKRLHAQATTIEDADVPRLEKLRFGRYSAALDNNGDGLDDMVRVYLHTLDRQDRFMPISGEAGIRIVTLADDKEPAMIAERAYDLSQLDKAYRTSIMGTHYVLEVTLPSPIPDGVDRAVVDVRIRDASSGVTHRHTQVVAITADTEKAR